MRKTGCGCGLVIMICTPYRYSGTGSARCSFSSSEEDRGTDIDLIWCLKQRGLGTSPFVGYYPHLLYYPSVVSLRAWGSENTPAALGRLGAAAAAAVVGPGPSSIAALRGAEDRQQSREQEQSRNQPRFPRNRSTGWPVYGGCYDGQARARDKKDSPAPGACILGGGQAWAKTKPTKLRELLSCSAAHWALGAIVQRSALGCVLGRSHE